MAFATTDHARRAARHERLPEHDRFWAFVDKVDGEDGCWLWTGSVVGRPDGLLYGGFKRWKDGRWATVRAHRYAFEQFVGPIPDGLLVCHSCDEPLCVRFDKHLFLGTHQTNIADRHAKGRTRAPRGEDNGQAKLTRAVIGEIRDSYAGGGVSQYELARAFGVTQSAVSRIVNRKVWV